MSAPKCPLCGVEMGKCSTPGRLYHPIVNDKCPLYADTFTDDEWAKLTDPNPWRSMESVPRDGRKIEVYSSISEVICIEKSTESFHLDATWLWRNHIAPPKPKEVWEVAWEGLPAANEIHRLIEDEIISRNQFAAAFQLGQAAKEDA